jgi:hypothetical protein
MNWGYVTGYFDGEGSVGIWQHGKASVKCSLTWTNTNRESLEAMRLFIGCGTVRKGTAPIKETHMQVYKLMVERRCDMLRVAQAMLDMSIIKRPLLIKMLERLADQKDESIGRGALGLCGVDGIRALYWDDKMSTLEIGAKLNVSYTAVKNFMRLNGIPLRTRKEGTAAMLANPEKRSKAFSQERNLKIAESKRLQWQDPIYRAKTMTAMKKAKAL